MKPHATPSASVDSIPGGFRLAILAGDERRYRVAQLDDYTKLSRGRFPAHPPWALSLLARASASSLPGTWGFGLWNDPFGLSLGFGGNPWRLPALPNAIWFFYASQENYLSLQTPCIPKEAPQPSHKAEPKAPARLLHKNDANGTGSVTLTPPHLPLGSRPTHKQGMDSMQPDEALATGFMPPGSQPGSDATRGQGMASIEPSGPPANGFMAQVFRSPVIPSVWLALGGLLALPVLPALPVLATRKARAILRKLVGRAVREDGVRLRVDVTQWHLYRLEWSPMRCAFWVDDALALETSLSPRPPLGLVIWIDNQYAAWRPDGSLRWGLLRNEAAWLEVKNIEIGSA